MKNTYILSLAMILFSFNSYSQNYKLEDEQGNDITNTEILVNVTSDDLDNNFDEVVYYSKFYNLTTSDKLINVRRTVLSQSNSTIENALCWLICHGPSVNLSSPILVDSLGSNNKFSSHFYPRQTMGTGVYNYTFFDINNPTDSVFLKITFTTDFLGLSKPLSSKVNLNFYPNPVNNSLNISLNSTSNSIKEIKITNILGTVVKSQSLGKLESSVTITTEDLEEGVYFVSVVNNGKIENSKRLVVKH
ncbi:MAG: T9SS type A sorting domain-containing protein [Bacteroidota bacterium]|jgi:hypothetical protein